ncbi:putative 60S ribosomal protein L12 [Leptomonas pyrrhocoris]|uniref:Putative 60S ribosomal protein L12 n=1 Tax=Leptomonas pyrrhocoris TaxID=157538 RepID=A0A0N0VHX9_LEPPY|nr:putative 60S ribosomal protein L12 [Leptomonas pyrrhocoris]KPA86144.1 putative 60S ribosomal protein L12 [Leptomonas pyrrhocoris]|eukprot:XP_015664583.1 putative 60S ribosomal protein L12 [Leptomonas pyrrhocoris]
MTTVGNQRVMVSVRVRPMLREGAINQQQEKFELQGVYRVGDNGLRVELTKPGEPSKSSLFSFDYIFDQESTQLEVYEDAVVDMVDAALVGVNATLLAYGQTGSGKTFTVLGDVKPNPLENDLLTTNSGMFLRVLSDLMDYKIRQAKKGWHVVVGLSCMEIYNENIRDLFGGKPGTAPPPLKAVMIGEDVILPSLIIKEMRSLQAVFNEIQLAISRRSTRATDSNSSSSRSHCLFSIDILQQAASAAAPSLSILDQSNKANSAQKSGDKRAVTPTSKKGGNANGGSNQPEAVLPPYEMPFQGTIFRLPEQKEPIYASKIILADLAGSERINRSHVTGAGLKEATSINSSLTALGNVVHSLHEGSFVSYRISNLTSLLKPTFSHPSSRVLLLAQCSPTQLTYDETVSTLHFANKVKDMKVTSSTGAEAEKLQFDFLESGKTYDSLLADLHIFAIDAMAKPAVIRRKLPQHDGVYYDVNASKAGKTAKVNVKDRRAAAEEMGAMTEAERERAQLQAQQDKEKAEEATRVRNAIDEQRDEYVKENAKALMETRKMIDEQVSLRAHHAAQQTLLESAARSTQIMEEEAEEWAALNLQYLQEHRNSCQTEVASSSERLEAVSREVNRQLLAAAAHETAETAADDTRYALSTWSHCNAKRFFSNCMELREDQMCVLSVSRGNAALERWKRSNAPLLKKFQEENRV